uniref:Aminopeptidase n=1 Tax=Geotrypetes seraphini TaxID=260995 RepID=A0A6P8PSL8_GEOSA|nr:aminopeptidase Q isoform X3 [Geotrypetes seraphini]
MGPKSSASGFYLSRAAAALLALLLAALVLALGALAALYARARLEAAGPRSGAAASSAAAAAAEEAPELWSGSAPTVGASAKPSRRPGVWDDPRLPASLSPVNYQLELWPMLEPDERGLHRLSGQVNISVLCAEETDTVLLHSYRLNYSRVAVLAPPSGEGRVAVQDLWLAEKHQYVVLELRETLRAGRLYVLQLDFAGLLANDLSGLFVSYYEDFGVNKSLIASQLEPTFARSVYPCFDEPAMKATFNVRLVHPPDYVALSNMPAIDIVALPDFGAGAMENWGLMTFQELSLMYNPSQKFSNRKALICLIISHELGHQWFGNLVTMKWWNDIWLNEGFASYMEYLGASYIDPRLKLNELFLFFSLQAIFAQDGSVAHRPLSVKKEEIHLTTHIFPLFNMFTYIKGASFLRMISGFLTERLFTKGLSSYLKKFSFSNVDQEDLWSHLQTVIDEQNEVQLPTSLKNVMDSWTWGKGIPILTLNTSTGILTENQFYLLAGDKQNTDNHTWIVPVSWIKNGYEQPLMWLDNRSKVFPEMQLSSEHEWILLNVNVTGYYRANYDQLNWDRLVLQLEKDPKAIPVANRVQLIDDAFTMAISEYIEIETALSITKYLAKEEEIIVWYTALKNMLHFENSLVTHKSFPLLKKYILKRISPIYHYYESLIQGDFDTTADDFFVQTSLETIIREACSFGLQDCLQLATNLYQRWMKDPSNHKIPHSIRRPIYCYGIAMGNEKEWEFAWEMYKESTASSQMNDLLYGLSCTREPWLLYRYLQNALEASDSVAVDIFFNVAKNEIGRLVAWEFITANWKQINSQFEDQLIYNSVLGVVIERISTDLQFQEVKLFINIALDEEHKVVATEELENAWNTSMKWRNKVDTTVYDWLQKNTVDSEF